MNLTVLQSARNQVDEANKILKAEAKHSINTAVQELLSHPDIDRVVWAAKSSEYNDQGMYPGICGPFLYGPSEDVEDVWELLYHNNKTNDPRANDLNKILQLLGEEILTDIFYDEYIVFASLDEFGNVTYETEYAGV